MLRRIYPAIATGAAGAALVALEVSRAAGLAVPSAFAFGTGSATANATANVSGTATANANATAPAPASAPPADVRAAARAVDAACEAAWQRAGITPKGPAPWERVARRLALALAGTVPSLEELRALEALPEADRADAYLDRLLADRRFADTFAERFARAYVGALDGPFIVFRRRRFVYWLSDAIAGGTPLDQIARELIASEGLPTDQPATNFITAHERDPARLAARTARAFLGAPLDCAQCHDHPFAAWKQSDFEGLAAFYAGVEQGITGIQDDPGAFAEAATMRVKTESGDRERPAEPRVPFAQEADPGEGRPRERLSRWATSPENTRFSRALANRVWALLFGQPLTWGAVDDLDAGERLPGALDALAADLRGSGHDLKRIVRVIAGSRAFRMAAGGAEGDAAAEGAFAAFPLTPLRAEQIAGALAQIASLRTITAESHIVWRLMRLTTTSTFVEHYGDAGEEELRPAGGTVGQRLALMNGEVVAERIGAGLFSAAGRIARLAPDDAARVKAAYWVVLTREPTSAELAHFTGRLAGKGGDDRDRVMEDMVWALVNATELSWNH